MFDACDDEFIKDKIKSFVIKREKEIEIEKESNRINNVRTTGTDRFDNVIKAVNYLGGHGTPKEIFNAIEALTGKKPSILDKNYITNALKSKNIEGVFVRTRTDDFDGYRVTFAYLTKENHSKRKMFVKNSIDNIEGTERMVFNIVNAIKKEKFSLLDILAYKQSIQATYPEIEDVDFELKAGLNQLVLCGILEKSDDTTFRKVFQFA